jgi:proline dehydrogenase
MGVSSAIEKAIAGKWIAGASIGDAIRRAKALNSKGIRVQINYLGELFTERKEVEESVSTYLELIRRISKEGVKVDIAVKATQIGMLMGSGYTQRNYAKIVALARQKRVFVWMDMEEVEFVDRTIALYDTQVGGGGVGICIQSYLKRSKADIQRLIEHKAVIRLVKGAHATSKIKDYMPRPWATRNYRELMGILFRGSEHIMVATHDKALIRYAARLNRRHKRFVEYAMLNGIMDSYAGRLASSGEHVSMYVPFGSRWIDYSYRRLKELSNLKIILRSILSGE